jgi:hypothetical protein
MKTFLVTVSIAILAPLLTSLLNARANSQVPKKDGTTQLFDYPGGPSILHGRSIRILGVIICLGFAAASLVYNVWVVCGLSVFMAVVVAVPWSTSLRIDDEGVHQDGWRPFQRTIKWKDISAAEFNKGDQSFNVIGKDGNKITHNGHVALDRFRLDVLKRTNLPLTLLKPGVFGMNRTQVPHEELTLGNKGKES